jgi:xanthosine utilization system XapX-like protein
MVIALGVQLGSEAVEAQRQILDCSTCESWWCKNKSLRDDQLSSNDTRHQQEQLAAEILSLS